MSTRHLQHKQPLASFALIGDPQYADREPEVIPAPASFSREFLDYMKFLSIEEIMNPATFERFREFLTE